MQDLKQLLSIKIENPLQICCWDSRNLQGQQSKTPGSVEPCEHFL